MSRTSSFRRFSIGATAVCLICHALVLTAIVYVEIGAWRRDLHTPLVFSGDASLFLMQSKSTVDNGWWWSNRWLGAPFVFDERAFPVNTNVDQAVVFLTSRFVRDPIGVVTITWVLMVMLSGMGASCCMQRLGVSKLSAVVAGTLFAVCPFALYRNIDHFCLVIYLVPFPSTVALLLASGVVPDRRDWWLLGALVLLGFNYIYYAFFACFCLGAAALVGTITYGNRRILWIGIACVALVASCTVVNLAPSLKSWRDHGTPIVLPHKVPAQAETYGLTIRHLISPVFNHPFPPFRRWADSESAAGFSVQNEGVTSRLGIVGAIGFLSLLLGIFVPGRLNESPFGGVLVGASRLTVAALLLSTVGGFGSVFSFLVTPEIRAYNRISPFIEFFALTAVAIAIDAVPVKGRARTLAAIGVFVIGLVDQGQASLPIRVAYQRNAIEIRALDNLVASMTRALPRAAMVFQLPIMNFLNEPEGRMKPYDHFKPYLVSLGLRWSYPALSNEQSLWQQAIAQIDLDQLPGQLAAEGFAGILVDRYGYDDNGAAVDSAWRAGHLGEHVIAQTDRYLAFDIRSLAGEGGTGKLPRVLSPATVGLGLCGEPSLLFVDRIGSATAPFSNLPVRVSPGRPIEVVGWAVDTRNRTIGRGVDVVIDQKPFRSVYSLDRFDVAAEHRVPSYRYSGYTILIAASDVGRGNHALSVRVVSSDGQCYYELAGPNIFVE